MKTAEPTQFQTYGLSAFAFDPVTEERRLTPGDPHTHLEMELTHLQHGSVVFRQAGVDHVLEPGDAALLWGGFPHQIVEASDDAVFHVAQIPFAVAVSWQIPDGMEPLLRGLVVRDRVGPPHDQLDRLMFARWAEELPSTHDEEAQVVQLEVEARIRRLLRHGRTATGSRSTSASARTLRGVSEATLFVTHSFTEPISVRDIAASAGWSQAHLSQAFKTVCGVSLWDYVTRLRVGEAERLLVTTDLPVMAVAHQAGFVSQSRLYAAFARYHDVTPGAFRARWGSD